MAHALVRVLQLAVAVVIAWLAIIGGMAAVLLALLCWWMGGKE